MVRRAVVLVLAAALAAGLGSAAAAQGVHRGGTIRVALSSDIVTMDPHVSGAKVDRQPYQSVFDKLVDTDEHLAIVPVLATSWTVSPDGRVVTFKLRQGVKFHDGTPFNADAVRANFDRMLDPKFPPIRKAEMRPVQRVVAVDPSTVQVVMERPYSPLLYALTDRAGMMLSPAALAKEGMDFGQHPVGAGPFRFVERVPNDHITLERNPDYWAKGLPYADRIVFRAITSDPARIANLKSGDVDIVADVPLPQVPELAKEGSQAGASFRLLEHGAFQWNAMPLNVTRPPFDNKLLRQALSLTIDRQALANVVLRGAAYPGRSFFPNSTPAYDPSIPVPPRNITLAKERLAQAGHPGGFTFTLLLAGSGQQDASIAQAIQSMAADAGIHVEIQILEGGAFLERMQKLQHEATLSIWSGRPDPDFDVYPFVTQTGIGGLNLAGYVNDRATALLDGARLLSDMGQRRRAYTEVSRIVADDMPYVFLFYPKEYKLISSHVRGFVQVPDGMVRLRSVWLAP
jgi:peptide/nickel transport system substrate-binding protein